MFFGKREKPQGMSMKTKFLLILFLVALFYVFKGAIMAHFGFEPAEPVQQTSSEEVQAPSMLPATAMVVQNATVFQEPNGRKPYASVGAGQPVSILDVEDRGQHYISVRHNGMAGYMQRRDLNLGKK